MQTRPVVSYSSGTCLSRMLVLDGSGTWVPLVLSLLLTRYPPPPPPGRHRFSTYVYLVAQSVNNLSAMQETQVRFLGQEDPLEKGMATHSSILSWRIP